MAHQLPQIARALVTQRLGIDSQRPLGNRAAAPIVGGIQARGGNGDIGQLVGAMHIAMAGKNLLAERRARARHAHDKDRQVRTAGTVAM
mgnify:CR=1 FL=1